MESLQFAERQGLSWLHPIFEKAGFVLGTVCVCEEMSNFYLHYS